MAIPGRYTTATLLLKLAVEQFISVEISFDRIIGAVLNGECDAGLLIHEGQITYRDYGLINLLDLWKWWNDIADLPLPLGLNVIRRDLDEEVQREFLRVMRESISYALRNVDEAVSYAMKCSRGLDRERVKRFALMYVNEYTYRMPENIMAMERLYEMAEEVGILKVPRLDILE